jgi:predicted nucleotidyltransferase
MDSRTSEAITVAKKYVARLVENNIAVEQAYLYGSFANGRSHKDSDIDVVIVSRQFGESRYDNSVRIMKFRRGIDLRISPLGYHPDDFVADNLIPYEAMTKGIRIA